MAALTSQGCTLGLGDGADPEVFTAIGELISVSGLGGGTASEIDVTNLSSTGKEFILGLKDEGEVSLSLNLDTANAQQNALRAARDAATSRNFKLTLTDSPTTEISFTAFVKTFNIGLAVDDKIGLEVALRLTGAATLTTI